MPFFAFKTYDHLLDDIARTENDDLVVKVRYSTAVDVSDGIVRNPISYTTATLFTFANIIAPGRKAKQYIIPLTTEYLGAHFYRENSTRTIHILDIAICDKSGNCSSRSFYFFYRIDISDNEKIEQKPVTREIDYDSSIDSKYQWNGYYPVAKYEYTNNNLVPVNLFIQVKVVIIYGENQTSNLHTMTVINHMLRV